MKLVLQNRLIDTDLIFHLSDVAGSSLPFPSARYILSDMSIIESDNSFRAFLKDELFKNYFKPGYSFTITIIVENGVNPKYEFYFENKQFTETLKKQIFSPSELLFNNNNPELKVFRKGWVIVKEEDLKELEKADLELKVYVQSVRDKLAEYWENNPSKYPNLEDMLKSN
jgi:hypothetical protein